MASPFPLRPGVRVWNVLSVLLLAGEEAPRALLLAAEGGELIGAGLGDGGRRALGERAHGGHEAA